MGFSFKKFFNKEQIITVYEVPPSVEGDPYIRVPNFEDKDPKTIRMDRETGELITLWEEKMRYPYKTLVSSELHVKTNFHEYVVSLILDKGGFFWNGQNIPAPLWSFIKLSKHSPEGLQASKWHDSLLYKRKEYYKEFKKENESLTPNEFRRLTSLIFRQLLINNGVGAKKAAIMSWLVDVWQTIRFVFVPVV